MPHLRIAPSNWDTSSDRRMSKPTSSSSLVLVSDHGEGGGKPFEESVIVESSWWASESPGRSAKVDEATNQNESEPIGLHIEIGGEGQLTQRARSSTVASRSRLSPIAGFGMTTLG